MVKWFKKTVAAISLAIAMNAAVAGVAKADSSAWTPKAKAAYAQLKGEGDSLEAAKKEGADKSDIAFLELDYVSSTFKFLNQLMKDADDAANKKDISRAMIIYSDVEKAVSDFFEAYGVNNAKATRGIGPNTLYDSAEAIRQEAEAKRKALSKKK